MDYRKILLAYMRTVLCIEGVTYVGETDYPEEARAYSELSVEEKAELAALDREARE